MVADALSTRSSTCIRSNVTLSRPSEKMGEAKQEIEKSGKDQGGDPRARTSLRVRGRSPLRRCRKKFDVRIEETVKQLLDKAIAAFGPLPNPHTLALYKDGKELADSLTVKQAEMQTA